MKYGYFDDSKREYIITTPETPCPWINYSGTQDFFSIISNTAGGYCFYKDARLRRITRYRYNSVPADNGGGRYFYISDNSGEHAEIWSPGWAPVRKKLDDYECRHGMGYTKIKGIRNGITADVLIFVPLNDNCEIHKVSIKNTDNYIKKLTLFSFIEFCLWNAYDDMTNFQRNLNTGEVEYENNIIYHKTEYRERRNHFSFYSVNTVATGFDTDRTEFLGVYNGFDSPEVVTKGKSNFSMADGLSPVASHSLEIILHPGEMKEYVFVLGYIENDEDKKWQSNGVINKAKAVEMAARYATAELVDKAFARLGEYWERLLSNFKVQSNDARLDRMVNIWNQYQCMVTFNMSRSASFFESGIGRGMGFRDSNQDILGFVHQIPQKARDRIIDLASTQFEDGGSYHQYQPLTKKGNNEIGGDFNDDPLWLILSTAAYIKETGDFNILDEQVPFDNNIANTATLFDHLKRSFYHVVNNLGPHGLPLIGRADWNDCLNLNCFSTTPDESYQTTTSKNGKTAESVLIAGMFIYIGNEFVKICENIGYFDEERAARHHIERMQEVIMRYGYDDEWFLRAYDDYGFKVGSKENAEGKIFIEPQGFCVMAGLGVETGEAVKALDSVKKYLYTGHGLVLLNPAYTKYYVNLGEISSYPPGYKENAGVFCHNNPWIMAAETMIGRGDMAFKYYSCISPAYREEISEVHKMEPYVYSQMIAGKDAGRFGQAKNSWLTGAAAWNFVAVTQWILGIKPDYNGLKIDPCIPAEWDGYRIQRRFRSVMYDIAVKNPDHVSKGLFKLLVDGKEVIGNQLPLFKGSGSHYVEAVMG